MSVHVCRESNDPRRVGHCPCGKRLSLVLGPGPIRRNLELERAITLEATRLVSDPSRLIEHAETRAIRLSAEYVGDPMLIAPGRDRVRDVREEIADARNHVVFWFQENPGEIGSERAQDLLVALRHLALAYDRIMP